MKTSSCVIVFFPQELISSLCWYVNADFIVLHVCLMMIVSPLVILTSKLTFKINETRY